ncbi:WhiB family transcriptional regulator [Nocardia sp. NPDC004711]
MIWQENAACVGMPTEAFFPPGGSDDPHRRTLVRSVIQVCEGCPVRRRCAQAAVENGERYGIFAGVDLGDGFVNRGSLHHRRKKLRRIAKRAA